MVTSTTSPPLSRTTLPSVSGAMASGRGSPSICACWGISSGKYIGVSGSYRLRSVMHAPCCDYVIIRPRDYTGTPEYMKRPDQNNTVRTFYSVYWEDE